MINGAFTFGIITDTHIRDPAGDLSSPFPVNEKANERAILAIEKLVQLKPDFIVHLGDMVHPLPNSMSYALAADYAKEIFDGCGIEVHYTPGNHDIGDKPMPGSPAACISEESRGIYRNKFGNDWYQINCADCALIFVNSSLWNSGLPAEHDQFKWLQSALEKSNRAFIFSHYPHFIHDELEGEHYDNIAQPARDNLLDLYQKFNVEAVFSGHVHHFFLNRTSNTNHYVLPATSFVRQDYAELFKVSPTLEHGRDDIEKHAVTLVAVNPDCHKIDIVPLLKQSTENHQKNLPLTVHLRHAWHESIDLPYNGPMEEFSRKRARNDYTLMRLWQMGIEEVHVPLTDFNDASVKKRIEAYISTGINFNAFGTLDQFEKIAETTVVGQNLINRFELIGNELSINSLLPVFDDLPVALGYAATGRAPGATDGLYFHSVSSGFRWPLQDNQQILISAWLKQRKYKSVVFQLPWESSETVLKEINDWCDVNRCICDVNVKLAKENPAMANFDDEAIAKRIRSILESRHSYPNLRFQLDTFVDMDRGFSPRHGLLDRSFNLRFSPLQLC